MLRWLRWLVVVVVVCTRATLRRMFGICEYECVCVYEQSVCCGVSTLTIKVTLGAAGGVLEFAHNTHIHTDVPQSEKKAKYITQIQVHGISWHKST